MPTAAPYFCADGVTLHCGDALAVLPTLAAGSMDSVVTDPPWMDYETGRYDASEWHHPVRRVAPAEYVDWLHRVMRPDSAAMVWCRWDCFEEHAAALKAAGFAVRNQVVWAKPNHTAGDLDGNLGNQHECAAFAVKGRWKRHDKREVNLWQEPHLFSRAKRDHPTQKPDGLMRRSVRLVCPPGGIVLDPFAGSGTTLVAAVQTGRRAIGVELSEQYCEIAAKRIEEALNAAPLYAGAAT
jgi:site-specific DNA-methyltransferase (adenine-specific)